MKLDSFRAGIKLCIVSFNFVMFMCICVKFSVGKELVWGTSVL